MTTALRVMAYQTFRQEYMQMPVVTRAYTTACVITTLAVVCVEFYRLILINCIFTFSNNVSQNTNAQHVFSAIGPGFTISAVFQPNINCGTIPGI